MQQILLNLTLEIFRNYTHLSIDCNAPSLVLFGENGAGKTNLLEAVSLLAPGRGLRQASLEQLAYSNVVPNKDHKKHQNNETSSHWQIGAKAFGKLGEAQIGTGAPELAFHNRRRVRINRISAKQHDLAHHLDIIWLTPAMDRVFSETPAQRRRFLDRFIITFDPAHLTRCTRYERLARERIKILEHKYDDIWLTTIESQMAATSVAIAAARLSFVKKLNEHSSTQTIGPFPQLILRNVGHVESALEQEPALAVEQELGIRYKKTRQHDHQSGRTSFGANRSDFEAFHIGANQSAAQCSTGQQKSCLIAIILAYALLCKHENSMMPILLLDEINAHLDYKTKNHLFEILAEHHGQIWMSGIAQEDFTFWNKKSQFFHIANGRIMA